ETYLIGDVLVYSDDSVITAEIFPFAEAAKALSAEELEKKILEAVDGVNKTVSSAKAVRRVLLRDAEFEKTTSKKIKRNQPRLGKRIR
ncbi:MAG: long-chain fatty acid--CoA ligase, partial [Oscillospiraceae bacterium]|nr:long-chain fatty acid--CoA ligase [Oscillospiraceae bacterium]